MTQKEEVLNHLLKGNRLTPIDALHQFGCFRLAAVINVLRNEGVSIQTVETASKSKSGRPVIYATYKI